MLDNESDILTTNSGCLTIARKTFSIFFDNFFKLLLLLMFYLAIALPQEHFHFTFFETVFDSSFLQKDIIDILQIIIDGGNILFITNYISFGLPALFFLILTLVKLMICLSYLKIIHEDTNIVFAFLYELKETILFVIDRIIATIIIYAPAALLFFLLYKKYGHIVQLLSQFPGFVWWIFLAAAFVILYYANRFGSYIYNLICEKINYTGPESAEVYRLIKLYAHRNVLEIISKVFAIATLVFLFQLLISLIPFPTKIIIYDISINSFTKIILDFFTAEFYIVAFYLIYQIYREKFEKNFKDLQIKEQK